MTRQISEGGGVGFPVWESDAFAKRLREAAGDRKPYSLERLTGIAESLIRKYMNGQSTPGADKLVLLAAATGVSIEWLATGQLPPDKPTNTSASAMHQDDYALIPRYDIQVSTGHGALVEHEAELGRMAFRRDWLRQEGFSVSSLVLVSARGDSMEPSIGEGDLLLVDTSRHSPQDDGIYVLRVDDDVIAKRLQHDWQGGLWVRSDNPLYNDQHITDEAASRLKVVGRVVWVGRRV
jgi:phage repressor protein C with HTH and peptisase S24 domain